jgi:hypothetical protein
MLIQLPNGNWIDLRRVVGIVAIRKHWCHVTGHYPNRVRIDLPNQMMEIIHFEDYESAEAFRDELANKVNTSL